jgi:hypothetical protein
MIQRKYFKAIGTSITNHAWVECGNEDNETVSDDLDIADVGRSRNNWLLFCNASEARARNSLRACLVKMTCQGLTSPALYRNNQAGSLVLP